jgi:hypothetical protein
MMFMFISNDLQPYSSFNVGIHPVEKQRLVHNVHPSVANEAATSYVCVGKVPSLNVGRVTGPPVAILSCSERKPEYFICNMPLPLPSKSLPTFLQENAGVVSLRISHYRSYLSFQEKAGISTLKSSMTS